MKNILQTTLALFIILIAVSLVFNKKNPSNFQSSPTPSPSVSPLYNDFHLEIPSISINAPVIADIDGADKKAYDEALENGVGQLAGSAKPGEGSNIFIFGHSSFYFWSPGNYKDIFRNLDDLKENDEIIIWYNQKEYKYSVFETKIVYPNEVEVTAPTNEEQVSLMTCWPPNTTYKRMIVIGKLKK